jgi:hypothetical protein
MIIEIPYKAGDDRQYLAAMCSLVASLASIGCPQDIYVTRIRKWFDRKWLCYSGKARVAFRGSHLTDTALDPLWRDHLTFPPFNPKQVGTQIYWSRRKDGSYGGVEKPRWIHKRELRHSADNLNNRVAKFTKSGLFVWFSADTEKNRRGSVLVYAVVSGETSSWYASFKCDGAWRIDRVEGVDKATVERCFPLN